LICWGYLCESVQVESVRLCYPHFLLYVCPGSFPLLRHLIAARENHSWIPTPFPCSLMNAFLDFVGRCQSIDNSLRRTKHRFISVSVTVYAGKDMEEWCRTTLSTSVVSCSRETGGSEWKGGQFPLTLILRPHRYHIRQDFLLTDCLLGGSGRFLRHISACLLTHILSPVLVLLLLLTLHPAPPAHLL
jgi:hypothetical protein